VPCDLCAAIQRERTVERERVVRRFTRREPLAPIILATGFTTVLWIFLPAFLAPDFIARAALFIVVFTAMIVPPLNFEVANVATVRGVWCKCYAGFPIDP
jgi:hypothetical protein